MRVYYEKLINPIEQSYSEKSTVENVLFLEDIVKDISRDIYIQYKSLKTKDIVYEFGNIEVEGTVKVQNHQYFMYLHKDKYSNYIVLENFKNNIVKVLIANSDVDTADYKIQILLNGTLIEEQVFTDLYSLYNRKFIKIDSVKLGTTITLTWPLRLNTGEYVEYTINSISLTEEPAMHRFLSNFDKANNCIIFDRKYGNNEINILTKSFGSVLRSTTINELYRLNSGSMVIYDENTGRLIVPTEQVFKSGKSIKFIKNQEIYLSPSNMKEGYNLIGAYFDYADNLTYDVITNDSSYSTLVARVNNFQLDTVKSDRSYIGFIIGLNNINTFIPTDTWLYNVGLGSGGGSGSSKIIVDFTSVEEIKIEYVAGTQCPIVQIYNFEGDVVMPENIHYNLNNEIKITVGELLTGLVTLI